jgi:D-sedoheptulose 7-phosphate isomerase
MHPQDQNSDKNHTAKIGAALKLLIASYDAGGSLLVCGNGGSAADCEHIVGELMKGFCLPRSLSAHDRDRLTAILW